MGQVITRGNALTTSGKSHSWLIPTRWSIRPSAATISVAAGSKDTIRMPYNFSASITSSLASFPHSAFKLPYLSSRLRVRLSGYDQSSIWQEATNMAGTMVAVFADHGKAVDAAKELVDSGVVMNDISLVCKDAGGEMGASDFDMDKSDDEVQEEAFVTHGFREVAMHDVVQAFDSYEERAPRM